MKTRNYLILAALAIVLFAACSQPSAKGTGSVRIDIPAKYLASASKDAESSKGSSSTLRIYLEVRGSFVPLVAGTTSSYYEASVPSEGGSITIDDVNPYPNANLYFSLGSTNKHGVFVVSDYAVSSSVTITAAATTPVRAEHHISPFTPLDCASDSAGIKATAVGGKVYAVDGGKLYSYTPGTWSKSGSLADLSGLTINGLEAGKVYSSTAKLGGDAVWMDTSSGVKSYTVATGAYGSADLAGASGKPVLDSGAFSISANGTNYDIAFYQLGGAIAFGINSNDSWKWTNTKDIKQVAPILANSSSIIITDKDINADSGYGYFITSVTGALGMETASMIDKFGSITDDISASQVQNLMSDSMVSVPNYSGAQPVVTSIARGGPYLYVGSDRNLFVTELTGNAIVNNGGFSPLIRSTTSISKVRACVHGGVSYAAAISPDGKLMTFKNGVLFGTYKSYMGLPSLGSNPSSMADIFWIDQGLVVSGVDGLAVLPFTNP